ncbi:hypothetical protein KDM87_00445 [Undibacterium sp. FT147W]|uniref:Uncharacterized protein n=1 Tax=Undibacterium rivi TaxID=2828729 RepID=A0ABS5GX69_9BURK|nr:hypothetical protein [Undibacterium rivi]MBR7791048.1 hypothetical protein [Undibacterium rivi]
MARSTKAGNAVQRLKNRSNGAAYSMVSMADGRFFLTRSNGTNTPDVLHEPLEIDAFVAYVNSLEKQAPKKVSKLDLAFEQKLQNSKK